MFMRIRKQRDEELMAESGFLAAMMDWLDRKFARTPRGAEGSIVALTSFSNLCVSVNTVAMITVGPLINESAYNAYRTYVTDVAADGEILVGGETLSERGYFVAPTVVDNLPFDNYAWTKELFVPLVVVGEFEDKKEAMQMVNDV